LESEMELTLTTPALLFPTISLLMVAYTNRFLKVASRIRELHSTYKTNPDQNIMAQIKSLKSRVILIRNMQALGIASLFLCVLCMFLLFAGEIAIAKFVFAASLILLMLSLALSLREVQISIEALNLALNDMENHQPPKKEP